MIEREIIEAIEVDVIPPAFSWKSQACQYAALGPPGLNHEVHAVSPDGAEVPPTDPRAAMWIDCLLMRDTGGELIGILNYYTGENPFEKPGSVNLWTRPDRQRRGIATALLREADQRWQINWRVQRYTAEGLHLLTRLIEKGELT